MAKIKVAGNAVVVESLLALEEIKMVEKYRPTACFIVDDETKDPVFAIGTTYGGGSINEYGAEFGSASQAGKACITMIMSVDEDTDLKEFIADKIGAGIVQLEKIERTIPAVVAEIKAEREKIMGNIELA